MKTVIFIHNIHILSNTYFPIFQRGWVATPVTPLGSAPWSGSLAPDPARVFIVFIRHSSDSTAANLAALENFRTARPQILPHYGFFWTTLPQYPTALEIFELALLRRKRLSTSSVGLYILKLSTRLHFISVHTEDVLCAFLLAWSACDRQMYPAY